MSPRPIVAFVLPDLNAGGAQKVMITLANRLDRRFFSPRLMVLGKDQQQSFQDDLPAEFGGAAHVRRGFPWLIKRLREVQPDFVFSTLAYLNLALLAAALALPRQTRIIVREANRPEATLERLPRTVPGRALYRWLYPGATKILAQTHAIAGDLVALAPRLEGKVSILPNPIDVEGLRDSALTPKRELGPGLRMVGAGRLTRQKGFDRLIEIAARLPETAHISIFGEGPDRAALAAQIAASGQQKKVSLRGFSSDLASHLAGADALIMTSRWEGLPNVALEALAIGTPVIASPQSGLDELANRAPNAVTIVSSDDEFVDRLRNWPISPVTLLRETLLPGDYEVSAVTRLLESILDDARNS